MSASQQTIPMSGNHQAIDDQPSLSTLLNFPSGLTIAQQFDLATTTENVRASQAQAANALLNIAISICKIKEIIEDSAAFLA